MKIKPIKNKANGQINFSIPKKLLSNVSKKRIDLAIKEKKMLDIKFEGEI